MERAYSLFQSMEFLLFYWIIIIQSHQIALIGHRAMALNEKIFLS
jgi:hypothetical protein